MDQLRQSLDEARRRRQVGLVTVLGPAGVGKSRLVGEFLAIHGAGALVLAGRCSPYGQGITYKPMTDMLATFPGGWPAIAGALTARSGDGLRAARVLGALMPGGTGEGSAGVEEIAWSIREVLRMLGEASPVIVVWEDLQWAEATLLDLIEDIASWLDGVPVLVICVARTELLEARASWGQASPRSATVELGLLTPAQSLELVSELLGRGDVELHSVDSGDVCRQIATSCEGNPLFAELIVDVFAETAPSVMVPPTVAALLGARLDRLPPDERRVLEMAAVIGREFAPALLCAMAAEDGITGAIVGDLLTRLARRRILQRGDDHETVRFVQALMRDTAYSLTPKSRREHWHSQLAGLLSAGRVPGGESDPLAQAYHVEAAFTLRKDLRPGDPGLPALAETAARALLAEGMRALSRKDLPAAAALLERGRQLLAPGDRRHTAIALHISDCAIGLREERRSMAAIEAARVVLAGDQRNITTCAIQHGIVALRLGLAPPEQVAGDALPVAAALDLDPADDLSWCRLHQLHAYLHLAGERSRAAEESFRLALARARSLNDSYEEEWLLCALCELAKWTPTSVREGAELCAELVARFSDNRALLVPVLVTQAYLDALAGRLETARGALSSARAYVGDLHLDISDAAVMEMSGFVESLAGQHALAERHYRSAAGLLASRHAPELAGVTVAMARELVEQGRPDEAARMLGPAGQPGGGRDTSLRARISAAAIRGRIASAGGRHDEAVALLSQARQLSLGTDDPCLHGELLFEQAIVLEAASDVTAALAAASSAADWYAVKGAVLPRDRIRDWLAARETTGTA